MKEAGRYQTVRRRGKNGIGGREIQVGGAWVYIPSNTFCKALKQSNVPCEGVKLKCTSTACKDRKRAKIMVHIMKA